MAGEILACRKLTVAAKLTLNGDDQTAMAIRMVGWGR
jgi:hypothetical protein